MCRAQLVVVLTCALGAVDADVQPDWGKLTDFSTKFSLAPDSSMLAPYDLSSGKASGEINLDLFGERADIKSIAAFKANDGGEGSWSDDLYIDGVKGHVAYKLQGHVTSPAGETITVEPSCVKVLLSPGLLPPPDMIKESVEQQEPMITQFLQQAPHTEATIDGESVQLYPISHEEGFFAIRDDATPVGWGLSKPDSDDPTGVWTPILPPILKFTDWSQGSNIPDDVTCTKMSPEELLATPLAKHSLRQLDRVMALTRRMQPLQMSLTHLPAKPSLLFEGAPDTRSSAQSSIPGMMPTMLLAFVAGTLASLLAFAVLKPRRSHGTPLLENIA